MRRIIRAHGMPQLLRSGEALSAEDAGEPTADSPTSPPPSSLPGTAGLSEDSVRRALEIFLVELAHLRLSSTIILTVRTNGPSRLAAS